MAKVYSIDSKDGVTTVCFSKKPGLDDLCMAIDDVAENYLCELRLWDFNCGLDMTENEIRRLAAYGKSKFLTPSKVATVAQEDLAFGVARIHDAYRKDELSEQRVFRSEQEARVWLKQPNTKLSRPPTPHRSIRPLLGAESDDLVRMSSPPGEAGPNF